MMRTRFFQKTSVTEIGLGCWQLGGDWGAVSDDEAMQILRAAHDAGVRFFDTAAGYGGGRSERLLGKFRQSVEDEIFIATKIGRKEPTEAHLREGVAGSLERLGMESLDLLQLHCWPMAMMQPPVVWETLRALRAEGKIERFGASVESMDEARFCMEQEGLASLQIIFNILRQHPRDEIFAEARGKGVALIVRLPLDSGLLAGKFTSETEFGPGDHRNYNKDGDAFHVGETFGGLTFSKGLELVEELRPMLPDDLPMAHAAIRWVLDHDAVTVVIPGASRTSQAIENAAISQLAPLPEALHERLAEFYRERVSAHVRGQH